MLAEQNEPAELGDLLCPRPHDGLQRPEPTVGLQHLGADPDLEILDRDLAKVRLRRGGTSNPLIKTTVELHAALNIIDYELYNLCYTIRRSVLLLLNEIIDRDRQC